MKSINITPRLKPFGWVLFILSSIGGILYLIAPELLPEWSIQLPTIYTDEFLGKKKFFTMSEANLTMILLCVGIIAGGNIVGFAREKVDDEYLHQIRLKGLQYAFIFQSILVILSFLLVREMALMTFIVINFFVMMIVFVFITQILLYRVKKAEYGE